MKRTLIGKSVIVFDLDGTLAKSKLPLDPEMAKLLAGLTSKKRVAIIGGGKLSLFRRQILDPMKKFKPDLENLLLFPTSGAALFRHKKRWMKVYELRLSKNDVRKIKEAFKKTIFEANFKYPKRTYGPLLENRGTQMTFSALGQNAPLPVKKKWNRESDIRSKIMRELKKWLRGFEVRQGGLTSIDVTKKGIDKGYAVRRLMKILHAQKKSIVFIGDAIFPGGNDYSVKGTGVSCIEVSGVEETKKIIKKILS